jgi:isopentenyl diphosphate isomerase/L-lactate dehydrogenase-like FMN-dependent dehydrogenase
MVKSRNVDDYRRLAAWHLPRMVFDYLEGGAESERGLRRNCAAFETICFDPWRLLDVSQRDLSVELFGRKQPMPLVIAPTGLTVPCGRMVTSCWPVLRPRPISRLRCPRRPTLPSKM